MPLVPIVPASAVSHFQAIAQSMNTRPALLSIVFVMTAVAITGCHRQYYRKQADCEAYSLLDEKSSHVARPPNTPLRIEVDRRSRMFNPFDLDFQPMPLDDPASWKYMQCVDGRRGYPMWEAAGVTNTAESPDWWQFLPLDDDGVLVLNAENAVRIALLHSADYQRQVEQLYFSALDVSTQRFQFDTQFNGGLANSLTALGRQRGGGQSSTQYQLGPSGVSMNRAFVNGADLVVNFANSIVWELSGPDTRSPLTSTVIDFSLLQPLLRGAGRDRIMEQLTQSERTLLADVRAFERFRRSFFLRITTGRGLELGADGIVRVNTGVVGGAGGYLGLLQTQLQIRNQEENIARQTEFLLLQQDNLIELLTKIPDDSGQIISERLQIAQAQSRLLTSQTSLVNQQTNYRRALDAFMRDLGLPPYICAQLQDPILDQFQLIDRELLLRREQLSSLRASVGGINVALLELGETTKDPETGIPETAIAWTPQLQQLLEQLQIELQPLSDFNRLLAEQDLPTVAAAIESFEESLPQRQKQNAGLQQLYQTERQSVCALVGVTDIDESIFELSELTELGNELRGTYAELEMRLQTYQGQIEELQQRLNQLMADGPSETDPVKLADTLRDNIILFSQDLLAALSDDVLVVQLIQARARTEGVLLPEVDIDPASAFEIARKNRRDWANARAALVDSWRAIEVVADQLESRLDVVFEGDLQSIGDRPFDFRRNGRLRVGLEWDAPITRIQERNDYRAQLIRYEQDRRAYYAFEDDIWQLLRSEIRQLQANRYNFELGRQAIRIAAAQIELNGDIRTLNEARGRATGPTAARDAIDALTDLLNAQNNLLNIFVNYEVIRRGLDFDLGTMELSPEGLWIDPGAISPDNLLMLPGTTSDGMIECNCNDCGLPYNPLPPEPTFNHGLLPVSHTDEGEDDGDMTEAEVIDAEELPPPVDSYEGALPSPVHVDPMPIDQQLLESDE